MYADTGLMFPYFHNLSSDVQPFDDFCPHKFITSLDNLIQSSSISDYDLGGEGDLFKAPEPIIMDQQPLITIDPITSMVSCAQDPQQLQVTDIETLKNEEFLNDIFFECKILLAKEAEAEAAAAPATKIGTDTDSSPLSEVLSFSFPVNTDENKDPSCQIPKSMSCDSLTSMEWIQGAGQQVKFSNFLKNFSEMDFGMRRAFSEGDIKTLSDANYSSSSVNYYPFGHPPSQLLMSEDRMQKLSRYRNKKTKRNFGRKIKYACRKALADSQPRIRGRFAKTETSS